jgi:hypothetical protein
MGFDLSQLKSLAIDQGFSLESCIYIPDEQKRILRNLVKELIVDVEKDQREDVILNFFLKFWKIAPSIKHPSFCEEEEWRLISKALGTGQTEIHFRRGKSMIIPYVKFKLGNELPLREIIVGPTPHMNLSVNSVKILLLAKKVRNIDVKPSSVPYRSW